MPGEAKRPWWQALRSRVANIDTVPASKSSTALSLEYLESPDSAIAFGYRIIFLGIATFVLWASLVPLDEGVPSMGVVAVESKRTTIAPLTSGLVVTLNVVENQHVKAGDVLVVLDDIQPLATYDTVLQQHFALAVKLARLEAEQRWDASLTLPDELASLDNNAWAKDMLDSEVSLLTTRHAAFENEMAILRERLTAGEGRLRGLRQQLAARQQQYELLNEQSRGLANLVEAGHSSRNQLIDAQRNVLEISRLVSELESGIAVSANTIAELRLQQVQRRRDVQRDLETDLVKTRTDLASLTERLKSAREDVDRTVIKSPIDGQVVSLKGVAPGTNVANGLALMDVIPEGERLLIDVQVAPHLIDRVSPGLASDIRINAFPDEPQLIVSGKVVSVAGDQVVSPATGQSYFLARLEITPEGLTQLGSRKLRPGMPVDVIIKTGERSFFAYLVKPLTHRIFSGFKEH